MPMEKKESVVCPLHNDVDKKLDVLFEKHEKLFDKVTMILIIQIITAFIAGGDLLVKLFTIWGRLPK